MVLLISVVIVYFYLGHIVVSILERLEGGNPDFSSEEITFTLRFMLMSVFPVVILLGLFYYTRKFILNVGRKNDV